MDKIIKINSVTAPPFTANQNLVRFRFGGGDVYNLRDSYINLNVTFDVESTVAGSVNIPDLQWVTTQTEKNLPQNVSFVRNAYMNTENKGMVESLSRVDLMKTNLHNYTKSQRELYSEGYLRCSSLPDPVIGTQKSIYRQINKTGVIPSRVANSVPISIRLGDIFDSCNTPEWDTGKTGDITFECELRLDKFEAVTRSLGAETVGADIPAPVGATTYTTIKNKYGLNDLKWSSRYVGEPVVINATGAGGAGNVVDVERRITQIQQSADGVLTYTFDSVWGTLQAGESYSGITVAHKDATSVAVTYDSAEVVLKTVGRPQGLDAVSFHTFSTEETNGNGITGSFQNQYQIEGEADSVFIVFPDEANDLNSTNTDITSYRLRLNNENLTNEAIKIDSPLYYDSVEQMISGMGHPLRNLQQNSGSNQTGIDWDNVYTEATNKLVVAGAPLWDSDRTKLLQVNIQAGGAGVKKLVLFKMLPRVFEF